MKTQKAIIVELLTKFNLTDYSSLEVGSYVDTSFGEFILTSKPNIFQPIDSRQWVFEQTADADGEPMMDGAKVVIQ